MTCHGCHKATDCAPQERPLHEVTVALAGNPNTGKSTVFNRLTGLRQHTGNWPGKTVARAEGRFEHKRVRFKLVDLPGTYSLLSNSEDELIARDFLFFGRPHVTVVVTDASALERNLALVYQLFEVTSSVVLCLNLMDEARRRGVEVDPVALSRELGVPVIASSARSGEGIGALKESLVAVATGRRAVSPRRVLYPEPLKSKMEQLTKQLQARFPHMGHLRWVALRLLDGDAEMREAVDEGRLAALDRECAALGSPPRTGPPDPSLTAKPELG